MAGGNNRNPFQQGRTGCTESEAAALARSDALSRAVLSFERDAAAAAPPHPDDVD
jgi:hypothetical protein